MAMDCWFCSPLLLFVCLFFFLVYLLFFFRSDLFVYFFCLGGGGGQLSYWYTGTLASLLVAQDLPVRSLESKEKSVNYVFIDYLLFYGPLQRKLIQLVM